MDINNLLSIAKQSAVEAGKEILKIYQTDDFGVEIKGDQSPLTLADKKSHEVITAHLKKTEFPVLSEEGSKISYEERKSWEYFWMIDPLDGTKEFIKKNGEFTVNIALIEKNRPAMGVVYAPVLDLLYWGDKKGGAYKNEKSDQKKISVSNFSPDASHLRVVASRSHLNAETEEFLSTLKEPEVVSMGSSLKFMLVAEGKADLYPRYAPTMEWDTAAAQSVVEAAGGIVYREPGRQEFLYNKENLLNPHFLVTGKEIV